MRPRHAERLQETSDPEVVQTAATIERAAQRLLEISEQIHEFSGLIDQPQDELDSYDVVSMLERVTDGFRADHPDATVRLDCPERAMVLGHSLLPAALGEFLEVAVSEWASPPDIEVVVQREEERVTVELRDHGRTIPEGELRILEEERESAMDHPEGLELWLVRWAVLNSNGELSVTDDEDVRITMRFHRSDDESG